MNNVPGFLPASDDPQGFNAREEEHFSGDLGIDGDCAHHSRGSLWDDVLEKSLATRDVDRIGAAIGLAEDGGASHAVLERARKEWRRLAEAGLLEAFQAAAAVVPGSVESEAVAVRLAQTVDQAADAGACPETVLKARAVLRNLKAPHIPSAALRGVSPQHLVAADSSPNPGISSPSGVALYVCKTPSPSRQSPLRGSARSEPDAVFFPKSSRGFSPGRRASPGRVAAQVLGRPLSGDLEAAIPKAWRKGSRSPGRGSTQVGERTRQTGTECVLQ